MNEDVIKLHDGTSHFNIGRNATATSANVTIECVGRCEHEWGGSAKRTVGAPKGKTFVSHAWLVQRPICVLWV
jgi:hypothetical protein